MRYSAFMSYSHASDERVASALHSALHRFARPWNRLRALHVFRDKTSLAVNPTLWPSIQSALDRADHFILLASPESAASAWVGREIEHWLARHRAARILIVLTGGSLEWDDAGAIDPDRTDALAPSLAGALQQEPLYLDLRWARGEADLTLGNARFRDAVAQLAATLHGRPKDELVGEDLRQYRRSRRLARSAIAALVVLTVSATGAAVFAWSQRNEARAQSRIALARQLAAQSTSILARFPDQLDLALLLALESTDRFASAEGSDALRSALALQPRTVHSYAAITPGRGRVRDLAFGPDGRTIAAGREDGTAEVLDIGSGSVLATLRHDEDPGAVTRGPGGGFAWKAPGVDEEVTSVAFSADGRLLATGSNDGTARVWEIATGRERMRAPHDSGVSTVAFDPAGTRIASGSKDGTLRVWEVASGRELLRIEHGEEVRQVAFAPGAGHLAAIATSGRVTLVSLDAGEERSWHVGVAGLGLAFDRTGARLAAANGDVAVVWDVGTGDELLRVMHGITADASLAHLEGWIDDVAFSPDGGYLATAGRDRTARVWSLASRQEVMRVRHGAGVEAVAFGPGGATLLSASYDGTARLWEVPTGRELLRAVHAGGAEVAAFSPDGARVGSGGMDGSIRVWELTRGDELARMPHPDEVNVVAFSPDGARIATGSRGGVIRLWTRAGEPVHAPVDLPVPRADRLVFGAGGSHLAAYWSGSIFLLDVARGLTATPLVDERFDGGAALHARHVAGWHRAQRMLTVRETAGGREVARIAGDGLWEMTFDETGTVLAVHETDEGGAGTLHITPLARPDSPSLDLPLAFGAAFALAPRGGHVAVEVTEPTAERYVVDHLVEIRDGANGSRLARIQLAAATSFLGFAPSGRHLVTVAGDEPADHDLRVWDVPAGTPRARLPHQASVNAVRFAADTSVLATISSGAVHLWDFSTGQPLGRLTEAGYVRDVRFSPDGRVLVTAGADGSVVVWLWQTPDLRAEACRRLHRNLGQDEWRRYLGSEPWRPTCPGIPS
jgi:WD40 repeat protein